MSFKKKIELSILFGFIFCIILSFADFDARCEEIKDGVLRLHIIANSDSREDQELKLKIRDAILEETQEDFSSCKNVGDAIITAECNIDKINSIANKTVSQNGYQYKCSAKIIKEHYNTRVYDDFTLPAGEYNSLIIKVGKAKGHNWWCIIFPGVCVPASCDNSLSTVLSKESTGICYNSEKYILRFKSAEIYEKIKENFKKIKK